MRPLPPTLRENRRYVLSRVEPPWAEIDGRSISAAVAEAVASLFGDAGLARIQPAVISAGAGHAIIRCVRSTEGELVAALATVHRVGSQRVALRPVRTSGTLRALRRAVREGAFCPATETGEARFGGRTFPCIRYQIEKVDLFEKGFKSQEPLFLTAEDLEE
ncbi:MAG: Rpp14/Pop5 family protein [Methanolinea sp.]